MADSDKDLTANEDAPHGDQTDPGETEAAAAAVEANETSGRMQPKDPKGVMPVELSARLSPNEEALAAAIEFLAERIGVLEKGAKNAKASKQPFTKEANSVAKKASPKKAVKAADAKAAKQNTAKKSPAKKSAAKKSTAKSASRKR